MSNVSEAEEKENPSCLIQQERGLICSSVIFRELSLYPRKGSKLQLANLDGVSGAIRESDFKVVTFHFKSE